MLKCIIIDDGVESINILKKYMERTPEMILQQAFTDPLRALEYLNSHRLPDLIFLDQEMPDLSGMDFVRIMPKKEYSFYPAVIFTTGHTEFAVESYEFINVVGFLEKPISYDKFLKTIQKVKQLMASREQLLQPAPAPIEKEMVSRYSEYIFIQTYFNRKKKLYRIHHQDLLWVRGQRNYVTFKTRTQELTVKCSLNEIENNLPYDSFVRIHKSYIINIHTMVCLENEVAIFENYEPIPIGRTYRDGLQEKLACRIIKDKN